MSQMYRTIAAGTLTSLALPLLPTTAAFQGSPYELSALVVERVRVRNTTISFTIHDPEPLACQTVLCTATWAYGSKAWPTDGYSLCDGSVIGWNMAHFESWNKFSIGIEHVFKDPGMGPPPYDSVVTYGTASFDQKLIGCIDTPWSEVCRQTPNSVVFAPITRSSAKRRLRGISAK
ncbi:hypothetical protein B0A48_18762 [Cryoendolithus antarcticus]|uniref:AA1-like domain-containing protein n=1 Tax=Cryoendolithus antarcticus TaxID=1507870 RepID=A0A1V8S7U1_9PEZI|nr:hypothetical protein B0A48_18762 [Cryoendolithus antarcticus]